MPRARIDVRLSRPADHVSVVVEDSPTITWAIAGKAASDIDVGFDLSV